MKSIKSSKISLLFVWLVIISTVAIASGRILYVDDDPIGINVGSSWERPINSLQDALLVAFFYGSPVEIRVAQGIYTPDRGLGIMPGDREVSFQLINGITIKGGYAGAGSPNPNARDIEKYKTTLSGDLNRNDIDVNNSEELSDEPTRAENSYHVITCRYMDETAVLDGVIIAGGNANGSTSNYNKGGGMYGYRCNPILINCTFSTNSTYWGGGGIYNDESSPTLTNCKFRENSTTEKGGGIYNDQSDPTLTNCTFSTNSAEKGGGMYNIDSDPNLTDCIFSDNSSQWGGGISNDTDSAVTVTNCEFFNNYAKRGGGIQNEYCSPIIINCKFSENSASFGGGMRNMASNPTVDNCIFIRNSVTTDGGGMYNHTSYPVITDCMFTGNYSSERGGGIYNYGGIPYNESYLFLTNCTFRENSTDGNGGGMYNNKSNPIVTNCVFTKNSASRGGGIFNSEMSNQFITNCIFTGNTVSRGGGIHNHANCSSTLTNCNFVSNRASMYGGGVCSSGDGVITATNCIFWNNNKGQIACTYGGNAVVSYSNVQRGWDGIGNIVVDPLFAEPGYWDPNGTPDNSNDDFWVDGDYHLMSEVGRWDPDNQSWVRDDTTSHCIDAGDPNSDWILELWPHGSRINIGVYSGTPQASMSPSDAGNIADLNADNVINFMDFSHLVANWRLNEAPVPQDLDRNGTVGPEDLSIFAENWLGQINETIPFTPILVHWKLDETEGNIAHDSIGDCNGILEGEPVWQPDDGMVDGAIKLDGIDDYIRTAYIIKPGGTNFSIFGWVKGGAPGQVIVSQAYGVNWLLADPIEGNLMTKLKGQGLGTATLTSQAIITDGDWHRIGITWDSINRILYVDDVEVASDTQPNFADTQGGLFIGAGSTREEDEFWSGLIDDIYIYDRAITP